MREREMRDRIEQFLRAAKLRVMLPLLGVGLCVEGCATGNPASPGRPSNNPKDAGADGTCVEGCATDASGAGAGVPNRQSAAPTWPVECDDGGCYRNVPIYSALDPE